MLWKIRCFLILDPHTHIPYIVASPQFTPQMHQVICLTSNFQRQSAFVCKSLYTCGHRSKECLQIDTPHPPHQVVVWDIRSLTRRELSWRILIWRVTYCDNLNRMLRAAMLRRAELMDLWKHENLNVANSEQTSYVDTYWNLLQRCNML